MDYGERQDRAEMLVQAFRVQGTIMYSMMNKNYSGDQVADEIENMTDFGRNLVAVAGLVLRAISSTPALFDTTKSETIS